MSTDKASGPSSFPSPAPYDNPRPPRRSVAINNISSKINNNIQQNKLARQTISPPKT